ncbi:hypothetical protein NL291_27435, partial [Klebsiella pneumoniae]|nr:hypothetical protein [Klebsiella pneumoniae]
VADLKYRLGRMPQLIDFVYHDSFDPTLLCSTDTKTRNYWSLLHRLKEVSVKPTDEQSAFLTFLSSELLNGKRPQELLLLRTLLELG